MAATDWRFPESLAEAAELLSRPGHQAVAGGTTLLDLERLGHPTGPVMVDLSRLRLNGLWEEGDRLHLGAGLSNQAAALDPRIRADYSALSEALLSGASGQIRNAATLGGNLLQGVRCSYFRDPFWPCNRRRSGSGCPAQVTPLPSDAVLGVTDSCSAAHPSDLAVALLALDGVVHGLAGAQAFALPMGDFYPLPEAGTPLSRLPQGGLITSVSLPKRRCRSGYEKLRGRASYEFAAASVAAVLELEDGRIQRAALAFGGIATIPWRIPAAEALLAGQAYNGEATDACLDLILAEAMPVSATAHKPALIRGALHHLLQRLTR